MRALTTAAATLLALSVPAFAGDIVVNNAQVQRLVVASVLNAQTSQTGAYTLSLTDCGTKIRDTGTTAHTYTVPTGLPPGCQVDVIQAGSGGTITFAGGSGETVEQIGGGTLTHATTGQFARATVLIDGASTFLLGGQVQ